MIKGRLQMNILIIKRFRSKNVLNGSDAQIFNSHVDGAPV